MKKFQACFLVLMMAALSRGQNSSSNSLTIHPVLSLVVQGLHVSYERQVAGRWSVELPLYFGYRERGAVFGSSNSATLIYGAGAGFRQYILTPNQGTYVSPQLEFVFSNAVEGNDSNFGGLFFPSLRMGYKLVWNQFVVDGGVGSGFFQRFGEPNPQYGTLIPMGNLALGIAF